MRPEYLRFIIGPIILGVYILCNYYAFWRVNKWFDSGLGWKFNLAGALISLAAFFLVVWHGNPFKIVFYGAGYVIGIMFFALFIIAVVDLISRITPFEPIHYGIFAISLIFLLTTYSIINAAGSRSIKHVEIKSPKIEKPTRIALIADTHITGYHDDKLMDSIVRDINQENPDMLVIAGDFADGATKFKSIAPVDKINAPVFLAMGNHDVWHNENGVLAEEIEKTKIEIVHNKTLELGNIRIIGFPYQEARKVLDRAFENIPIDNEAFNILIYHEPREIEIAARNGIDLMLCGHTHAGQIIPFSLIARLVYPYFKGLYNFENMNIYVSPGTSTWGPPMRLGSRNEITIIDLMP